MRSWRRATEVRLGAISAVTFSVPALEPIEDAYTRWLRMRVLACGKVGRRLATAWGAPAVAECRMLTLVPEVGEETRLRFVEDPAAGPCDAFATHGWNACELTVRDTDVLAALLEGSPFRIIGPPRALKGFEWIRAMQVLGPAGECLYLTDVGSDRSLAAARSMVGQVFIVVAGGPDIAAMRAFYGGNDVSDVVEVPIGVLNRAHGLASDTRHPLAIVTLSGGTCIELDGYPAVTRPRVVRAGHLPPGIGMVSFGPEVLGDGGVRVTGAAGEWIELVSTQG